MFLRALQLVLGACPRLDSAGGKHAASQPQELRCHFSAFMERRLFRAPVISRSLTGQKGGRDFPADLTVKGGERGKRLDASNM